MQLAQSQFTPSLMGTLITVLGVSLFSGLGLWQLHRADTKQSLLAQFDARIHSPAQTLATLATTANPDDLNFRPVVVTGSWDDAHTIFLDNKIYQRQPGYQVITPLRLPDHSAVLVNRGWVASGNNRQVLPVIVTPTAPVEIHGHIQQPLPKLPWWMPIKQELNQLLTTKIWIQLDAAAMRQRTGYPIQPFMILQAPQDGNELVRDWPPFNANIAMHLGYAIQWFVFAVVVLGVYLSMSFTPKRND